MIYPSLTDRLKNQHVTINAIIERVSEGRMNYHPEPSKWSIHDNITHLAVYQPVFINRINQILLEDNALFERYVGDEDENFMSWRYKAVDELIYKITADRGTIVQLILNLNNEQLSRTGTHLKYGKLSVLEWTEFFLLHEAHHLFTMFQLAHG